MKRRIVTAILLCCLGCRDADLRESSTRAAVFSENAVRVLVAPEGIGRMYDVASPAGFALAGERVVAAQLEDARLEIGPVAQDVPVGRRSADALPGSLALTTTFLNPTILVPVRVHVGDQMTICRFEVQTARLDVTTELALVRREDGRNLEVLGTPEVDGAPMTTAPVAACSIPEGLFAEGQGLETSLADYVLGAFAGSSATTLLTAPTDVLGLLQRGVVLRRRSIFDTRRGALSIEGREVEDAAGLTVNGLELAMDMAAEADRAPCAPPLAMTAISSTGASQLDAAELDRAAADVALAMSETWIQRAAQASTLAGFACRGLEDTRLPGTNEDLIDTDDALLDELGLGELPLGSSVRLTLTPGDLPSVRTEPSTNTIVLVWRQLTIEIFSELYGVWVRVGRVVGDVSATLQPRNQGTGTIPFDVEAVGIDRAFFSSELTTQTLPNDAVIRWMRRALLLMLSERLSLPLPLEPGTPLRVVGTQARSNDLVVFLKFVTP